MTTNQYTPSIRTVNFVSFSDLTMGLSQRRMDAITSAIADRVNWGYCSHSLIKAEDVLDDLEGVYSPPTFQADSLQEDLQRFVSTLEINLLSKAECSLLVSKIEAAHEEAVQQENERIDAADEAEFVRRLKALPPNTFIDLET